MDEHKKEKDLIAAWGRPDAYDQFIKQHTDYKDKAKRLGREG
jgi:hypothetical protein